MTVTLQRTSCILRKLLAETWNEMELKPSGLRVLSAACCVLRAVCLVRCTCSQNARQLPPPAQFEFLHFAKVTLLLVSRREDEMLQMAFAAGVVADALPVEGEPFPLGLGLGG